MGHEHAPTPVTTNAKPADVAGGGASTGGAAAPTSEGAKVRASARAVLAMTPWAALAAPMLGDEETLPEKPAPLSVTAFADAVFGVYLKTGIMLWDATLKPFATLFETALKTSTDRAPYAEALGAARKEVEADYPHIVEIFNDVADLIAGGDMQFNATRIMGKHGAMSLRGKRWFREAPEAGKLCLTAFDGYVHGSAIVSHAFGAVGTSAFAQQMEAAWRPMAEQTRIKPCQALYNLLRTGQLSGSATPAGATAPGVDPKVLEERKTKAEQLKLELRELLAPGGNKPDHKSGKDHKLKPAEIKAVMDRIKAEEPEVRELVLQDAELGRLIVDSSSETQCGDILRALDPVEALKEACYATRNPPPPEGSEPLPKVYGGGSPFEMIKTYLLAHPGKEGQAARTKVLTNVRLKDEFIDTLPDEQNRTIYRLIARGTDQPSGEDKVHAALRTKNSVEAVRGLQQLAAEDPDRLKELQGDQIFYHSISQLNEEVSVDGVMIRPFHLALTMWGMKVGNTEDPMAGAMQAEGGAEVRPLTVEQKLLLDKELFDPILERLAEELDDMHVSDSTVMSALRDFSRIAASEPLLGLVRRSGQPPGPALAEKYNRKTGRSLRNDIRGGCDEDNSREAERIIGATGDSATVGTLGNKSARLNDNKPTAEKIGLEQALRETLHEGHTLSHLIHSAAEDVKEELTEWSEPDSSDINAIWTKLDGRITPYIPKLVEVTGLAGRIHLAELLKNAYAEIGGSLVSQVDKRFSATSDEGTKIRNTLQITPGHEAAREKARIEATGEKPVDDSAARAEAAYAAVSTQIFQAISGLNAYSEQSAFEKIGGDIKAAMGFEAIEVKPVETKPGEAPPPPVPKNFQEFYKRANGIDPILHAQMQARALGKPRGGGPKLDAATICGWLGVPADVATAEKVEAKEAAPGGIAEEDKLLVRPDFTIDVAKHNAAEMWKLLHGGGEIRLITSILYGPYNDAEQKYIAAEFRQLSGGIDFHFYLKQLQEANRRNQMDLGAGFVTVGAEGTEEGKQHASNDHISIKGDNTDLETGISIGSSGIITAKTRVSTAVGNKDMDQLFRVIDDLSDAECRDVASDTALMGRMEAFCDKVAWDRIYRQLMGMGTLRDALESRAHGAYGSVFSFADCTDEKGMREDIKAYIKRLRHKAEDEIREAAKKETPKPTPEIITERVKAKVRAACQSLLANKDVMGIIEDELSGYDLAQTQGLIFNEGEENAAAQLIHDGDWSETESDIIAAIKKMPPEERARRAQDPEFLRRLGDLCDTEEQFRDAMNALMGGSSVDGKTGELKFGAAGDDHLAALDEASRSSREVAGDGNRDEAAIVENMTKLTPDEYKRLMANPQLMAQILAGLDDDPKERELVRKLMGFRAEEVKASDLGVAEAAKDGANTNPEAMPREEVERLAYLKHNAVERLKYGFGFNWDDGLDHLIEVFKLDFKPKLAGVAPAPAPKEGEPVAAPQEKPKDPKEIQKKISDDLRGQVWKEVDGNATTFAYKEHHRIKPIKGSDEALAIIKDAVMGVSDPSTYRLREQLGAWDDDDGVMATLKAASDDVIIKEWSTVQQNSPSGIGSMKDVYGDYKKYKEDLAKKTAADAKQPGDAAAVVTHGPDGTVTADAADSKVDPATVKKDEQKQDQADPTKVAAEPPPQVKETREEIKDPELERLRLAYMNYVIDLSKLFEDTLLGDAGGAFSDSDPTKQASEAEKKNKKDGAQIKVLDNNQWHEWQGVIRDRIPNLDKEKIAKAIGATDPEDIELITNPNRTARTSAQFRTYKYLASRGQDTEGVLDIAHGEGEAVDQAMARYGRQSATDETNAEGGYGVVTEDEGKRTEEKYGQEVDRSLEAYKAAKAAVAEWAALIVGLIITAVITILTAGVATGPAMAILMGAITAAASATGQAITKEMIQGADYDFSKEGLSSIATATVTGIITAGTTYYAQALMRGVSGMATMGKQMAGAAQVMKTPPSIWRELASSAGEEMLSEGMSGTVEAGLAAMDPSDWMHGFETGSRRASAKVDKAIAQIPNRVLSAGVTSIMTFGATKALGKVKAKLGKEQAEEALGDLTSFGKRQINVKENFKKYFGELDETLVEAWTSWATEKVMSGEKFDIENAPADLVKAFLQELSEKGSEMHNATATAGARRRQIDSDPDFKHMSASEQKAYTSFVSGQGETDAPVSAKRFQEIRQNAIDTTVDKFETAAGVKLTPDQRAAFDAHVKAAETQDDFIKRVHEGPLPFVVKQDPADATDSKQPPPPVTPPADQDDKQQADADAKHETAKVEDKVNEAPDPAAVVDPVPPPPPVEVKEEVPPPPVVEDKKEEVPPPPVVPADDKKEEVPPPPVVPADDKKEEAPPAPDQSELDKKAEEAAKDEQDKKPVDDQETKDQVTPDVDTKVDTQPTIKVDPATGKRVLDPNNPADVLLGEQAKADCLQYLVGLVQTWPLADRQELMKWLGSQEGATFALDLATTPDLGRADKAAAARQRAAEWLADFNKAGRPGATEMSPTQQNTVPLTGDHPVDAPEGAAKTKVDAFLVDENGKSVEDHLAEFGKKPWDDPVKQLPMRLQYEYATYLCSPPLGGKIDAAAFKAQWATKAQAEVATLAPTLSKTHVDALRNTYPGLTQGVPEGGPIAADALFKIFEQFTRAGDFAATGNDLEGFKKYIDAIASGTKTGIQGPAGIIMTDTDVAAIKGNEHFGRYDDSMNYIADPLQVAKMTPEQYSIEIGITKDSAIWPVASDKLREFVSLFGPEAGRHAWVTWVNAHGGFKTLTHMNVIWNGEALKKLLIYSGEHAMRGLGENVIGKTKFKDNPELFSTQLLGIPLEPGVPIGETLAKALKKMIGPAADDLTLDQMLSLIAPQPPGGAPGVPPGTKTLVKDENEVAPVTPAPENQVDDSAHGKGPDHGASSAIPGSEFHGKSREEADPKAIRTQIEKVGAEVAGMFPGVTFDAEKREIRIQVGERSKVFRIHVSDKLGTDVARFDMKNQTIQVSDSIEDDHVMRGLAHEVAEIMSKLEQEAGKVERSEAETLAKGADDSKLLSHHDMGRIAEIRVLLTQLESAHGDPERQAALAGELDKLLDHLGVKEEGEQGAARRKLIEAQLGKSLNAFAIYMDAGRRQEVKASEGVHGKDPTKKHGGVELHSHFIGVVEVKVFIEKFGGNPLTLLDHIIALPTRKGLEHLAHERNDKDDPKKITSRGTAGDAIDLARKAKAEILAEQAKIDGNPDLSEAEVQAIQDKIKELATAALTSALTATPETDFNSSYEIRDELIKDAFGGEAVEGETKDQKKARENAAYKEFAREALLALAADGLLLSEQSMSLNKLLKRFPFDMISKCLAELVEEGKLEKGQLDVKWLSMIGTANFGKRDTAWEGEAEKQQGKTAEEIEQAREHQWVMDFLGEFGSELAIEKFGLEKVKEAWKAITREEAPDLVATPIKGQVERTDVVGVDVAGQELFRFDEQGRDRFKAMYLALLAQAKAQGRVLVFRPHVGEGAMNPETGQPWGRDDRRQRNQDTGELLSSERARHNVGEVIKVLRELAAEGKLDPSLVMVRFGHATATTPDQAVALAELGVIAEVNLGSNVATGAVDQTIKGEDGLGQDGKPAPQEQLEDHSLLTLLYYNVKTILSTDAHDVMHTSMGAEYDRAYKLIEQFLAGQVVCRVRSQDAKDRGNDLKNGQVELSRDDLSPAELERFLHAYEQLHKWAKEYKKNPAGTEVKDAAEDAETPKDFAALRNLSMETVSSWPDKVDDSAVTFEGQQQLKTILTDVFGANWFLAKDCLINNNWPDGTKATAEQAAVMKALMWRLITLRQVTFNNLLRKIRDVDLAADPEAAKLPAKDRLSWTGGAGSKTITSDVDVNLKGPFTEKVTKLFNDQFSALFGLEAGTVFDVNVYALDFMHGFKVEVTEDEDQKKHGTITPGAGEGKITTEEGKKADTSDQEVMSLVHVRRYMEDAEWQRYCEQLRAAEDPENVADLDVKLAKAEALHKQFAKELKGKEDELREAAEDPENPLGEVARQAAKHEAVVGKKKTDDAIRMAAANRIYEEKLAGIAVVRKHLQDLLKRQKEGVAGLDQEIETTTLDLRHRLSEALLFANEAYSTDGGVNHVVVGMQIGNDIKAGKKLDSMEANLSKEQFLHSFNEQVGDVLKECHHYHDNFGAAAYKTGKYIDRMLIAAEKLGVTDGPGFAKLRELASLALSLKGDSNAGSEEQESRCAAKARELGFRSVHDLRDAIVALGIHVPIEFRQLIRPPEVQVEQAAPQAEQAQAPGENAAEVEAEAAESRRGLMAHISDAWRKMQAFLRKFGDWFK